MTPDDKKIWEAVTKSIKLLDTNPAIIISPRVSTGTRGRWYMPTTLDLHGYGLDDAHQKSILFIKEAKYFKLKYVRIVTGLSGQIRREFPFWIERLPEVRRIEHMNGGGAFKVYLKRN